jgi:hypothetical protein
MSDTEQQRGRSFTGRVVLLVFSLCALGDFGWSLLTGRSVVECVSSAILGLLGTGWYLLTMWASSQNDPDDPNEPARWVP